MPGVFEVKSLKTYNLDHDVITILSKQPNKSQYVCRAVRRLSQNQNELNLWDIPVEELLKHCALRGGTPPLVTQVIKELVKD